MSEKDVKIINNNTKNGQVKCPKCGASDVEFNEKKGKIICHYCSYEFEESTVDGKKSSAHLKGVAKGAASKNIDTQASDVVTLKCDGCGAEIVVHTEEKLNVKCHWCGSNLSINHQVDNGVVPDELLPFIITQDQAFEKMRQYVSKKLTFTTDDFKEGFIKENIRGVFFPYIVFDTKARGNYIGVGECTTHTYHYNDSEFYDADVYRIERQFDFMLEGLTIEASSQRLNKFDNNQKNDVINAIMPFDTENCIQFNATYMKDYTYEKRDLDIENIETRVRAQAHDIARKQLNVSLEKYDRGVRWDREELSYTGDQWLTAYLPVWLYSYQDKKGMFHYVALNGRTGETVGSIPFDKRKLFLRILFIFLGSILLGLISGAFLAFYVSTILGALDFLFLSSCGFFAALTVFIVEDYKYSNLVWKRHHYENETKYGIKYIRNVDDKIDTIKKTSQSSMMDANNRRIDGEFVPVQKKN